MMDFLGVEVLNRLGEGEIVGYYLLEITATFWRSLLDGCQRSNTPAQVRYRPVDNALAHS